MYIVYNIFIILCFFFSKLGVTSKPRPKIVAQRPTPEPTPEPTDPPSDSEEGCGFRCKVGNKVSDNIDGAIDFLGQNVKVSQSYNT